MELTFFFHRVPGSRPMSPDPNKCRKFQDWFEEKRADSPFQPYVKNGTRYLKRKDVNIACGQSGILLYKQKEPEFGLR